MKYLALVLVFATPAVLAGTINMACPPGDQVVVHTVMNNGDFDGSGVIDDGDVAIMKGNFLKTTVPFDPDNETNTTYLTDLNADGTTNLDDFALLRMLSRNQH